MKGVSLAIFACVGGMLPHLSDAHGRLTGPVPRSIRQNGGTLNTGEQNAPTGGSPLEEDFVCRNTIEQPEDEWTEVFAGQVLPMQWELTAKHIGDCFIYISCTPDLPDLQKEWFKIADVPYCRDPSKEDLTQALADGRTDGSLGGPLSGVPVNILIPDFLPASPHCILRWEWYALHQVSQVEYYAQCVDIFITGNPDGVAAATPLPTFNHADQSFPNLRTPAGGAAGYRRGFANGNQFLSSDIDLVSPGGDGAVLPPPPAPTPAPDGGDDGGDTGGGGDDGGDDGGDEEIVDDGNGLCFLPNTPFLDNPIDTVAASCGTTSETRCATGQCCSSAGFCGTVASGHCDANSSADYRPVACSSISNPVQEQVGYEDVDNCISVFCGDIQSICSSTAGCAEEWETVDAALNERQNVCESFLDGLENNFAKYSLQCTCDNCGALVAQLAGQQGGSGDGDDETLVIVGAVIGVALLGGLIVGGFLYSKKGRNQNQASVAKPVDRLAVSTELSKVRGSKSWMNDKDASSVV